MISIIIDIEQLKNGKITAYQKEEKTGIITETEMGLYSVLQKIIEHAMCEISSRQRNSYCYRGANLDKIVNKIKDGNLNKP